MLEIENTEIISYTIKTMLKIISKRTSSDVAYSTIDNIIKQLIPTYDFLRFIHLENVQYSESKNAITIDPEVNTVENEDLVNCIKKIVDLSTQAIGENADYFFIREIRDNLGYDNVPQVADFLINLNYKQFEYMIDRKREIDEESTLFHVKNSEIIQPLINALVHLLSKILSEEDAFSTITDILKRNQGKYDFLKNIKRGDKKTTDTFFILNPFIDEVEKPRIAEAFELILMESGKSINWKQGITFTDEFQKILGENTFSKIKKFGINFSKIDAAVRFQNRKIIIQVLQTLLDILTVTESEKSALFILDSTLKELQEKHEMLTNIHMNLSPETKELETFSISQDINAIESYKLGTALRDIIKIIQEKLRDKTFVENFKKKLGNEYLTEIEKLGVNLHFLELKYA